MVTVPATPGHLVPRLSVLVGTRGRSESVAATVQSVLCSAHGSFELVLVDQNHDDTTERAVQQFLCDQRFVYHRSNTRGSGQARNVAVEVSRGEFLAFTDDDCTIPAEWLRTVERIFIDHPRVGAVFCNVVPGDHDASAGFIPGYVRSGDLLVTNMRDKWRARGIGAGMAVRRRALDDIGGFDGLLGPGARFPGYVDGDLALRMLLRGWHLYETDRVAVTHHGFRRWDQGGALARDRWLGIGAAFSKPLKCGHWGTIVPCAYELGIALRAPLADVVRLRRPRGVRRSVYFVMGAIEGLGVRVDRRTLRFNP